MNMKWSIVFLASVSAVVLSVAAAATLPHRLKRQIFGDADPKRVPEMMTNRAFVETQGRCVVASEVQAASLCDRIGRRLRANLPIAIQKGDCPSTCNQHEKDAIIYVIKTLKVEYPNIWKSAVKHYKATPEQLKKLDDWITESSTSTTTSSSVSSSGSSPSSTTVTTTVPSTLVGNKEKTNASF